MSRTNPSRIWRPAVAWVLYGLGDLICRLFTRRFGLFYPVYNRLMGWSHIVQGPSGRGPWEAME
jgi:hypothetical protein